jgi:DeoR/GlpR family transcriptional regulator of sugar metabolism
MLNEERQRAILDLLRRHGRVLVVDLARQFHYGLSTPNLLEAKVNCAMIEISKVAVAVCDSSKFGKRSLSLITSTSSLQHVITDGGIPQGRPEGTKEIRESGHGRLIP